MTLTESAPVLVNSTLLASVAYAGDDSILQLEFCDGAIYRYFAVPADIHNGLLGAESKGSYFNREIRGRFRYALIRRPR
jgi:KTSC domain